MTIGIYALTFNNDSEVYVGQSVNIEIRISKHLSLLKHNKHYNHKLTNNYTKFGIPNHYILEICSISELNTKENQWIQEFDSFNTGLNLRTLELISNKGPEHSQAKFSREQIIESFKLLLDENNLIKDISSVTGVTEGILSMISSGKCHSWLQEEFPDEYAILLTKVGKRRTVGQSARGKGKKYPPIKSPLGDIITDIPNLKKFANDNGVNYTHLCQLLNGRKGKHCSVGGWTLA